MVSSPSPPPPPDPVASAHAQGQMNREAAISQAGLNSTDQVTPWGNLTYARTGTWDDGTPHFTATQTLSPDQQKLLELSNQTQKTLGQIGVDQSAKVKGILNTPFDLNTAINNQQSDIHKSLLDPVWNQRESALQSKLANQGVSQGSEAYTNALRDFGMQRDSAYNAAMLADRSQAAQEALTNRNQPLNEIAALMSGSQVQQPTFRSTPSESIAPPDYLGVVNNNYNGQLQAYNAQVSQSNAMMSGLFGLGGAALGGWRMSDRRVKEDIKEVGKTKKGLPIYTFRYKGHSEKEMGLMAQDVEKVTPKAVRKFGKLKAVNYDKALES